MHKCEHNKTIIKFCMSEHCQSKESGGCQDCMKKYHNHIGQVSFLNEQDVKNIVKKFQIQANYRPKSRGLQQGIFNFFTHIKTNITTNLDLVCKNLINQIGYPYLHKNGTLNCYKRLKNKEYRKVTQKQLKELYEFYKNDNNDEIIKQQKNIYGESLARMQQILQNMQKNIKQIFDNLNSMTLITKSTLNSYDRTFYIKINEIFKQIKKYPDISFPKKQSYKQKPSQNSRNQAQSDDKKKLHRDISLDKHMKIQNKLKNQLQRMNTGKIDSPNKKKQQTPSQSPIKKKKQEKPIESPIKQQLQKQKQRLNQRSSKKQKKYSFELKPQQIALRPPSVPIDSNFSQKQEEILERKRKLLDLMNSKPIKKQVSISKNSLNDSKKDVFTPSRSKNDMTTFLRSKQSLNQIQVGDSIKQPVTPDRFLIDKQFSTPSNYSKNQKSQVSFSHRIYQYRNLLSSKRAKTTYDDEQQTPETRKQTRNQTIMSSDTETEHLFNAKVHIPFDETKHQQQFEIKEESRHKCIVVPQVNFNNQKQTTSSSQQCQSPLLIKKKQIQNFSALIKLAQSKIIEQESQELPKNTSKQNQQEKSFIKINKILQDSNIKSKHQIKNDSNMIDQKNPKQNESVQINDNQQKSLALLLHSLKLPAPQAIVQLQKSLAYSSNNLSAAQYLSYLYLEGQRPQDCFKLCNDLLKSISSSQSNELALRLNINKSAALNHLGRYSECITFLQRCLRYRHNDILYKNLADAYYSIGILQKAIYNYEHSILQNSSNTQAHYNLAVCHYQQQNYHNSSIYIDKALKHQPNNQIYKQMRKYVDEKIFANQLK